ncbi:hypothetical protein C8F04DRAFT_1205158 [Mycena alexandri]|uniref:Uncharacterized protein n=1 Tax=Mycena alexandri TaxID=1745969 RepID=A0AAD6RWH9_9AGAR|nr:hypothetical protein C8F04DRAFT_1205158 [Mycena alexandri]
MDGFQHAVFTAATRNSTQSPASLRICGHDIDAAADQFSDLLDRAGHHRNYTEILVRDRSVGLTHGANAYGDGPEREVIFTVFRRFLEKEASFFVRGEGDCLLIRTMYLTSMPIPLSRLIELRWLGAVCGLLLVFGQFPVPISVSIFQYIFNHSNFHSIRRSFVQEWFPQLATLLTEFQSLAPSDDLTAFQSHFISHFNIEASAFHDCDLATHQHLTVMMLYKTTIAEAAFDQPELRVFAEGVLLPCCNGFNLGKHSGDSTLTFDMIIEHFLRGVGTPSPLQFQVAQGAFHPIIDLLCIDTPGFRAQALVWAATGSPFLEPTAGRIMIGPVGTDDPQIAHRERGHSFLHMCSHHLVPRGIASANPGLAT